MTQCTTCTPRPTGEKVRVKFVGEDPTFLVLASYRQCGSKAVIEEVIDTVVVAGVSSELIGFHCAEHQLKETPKSKVPEIEPAKEPE